MTDAGHPPKISAARGIALVIMVMMLALFWTAVCIGVGRLF